MLRSIVFSALFVVISFIGFVPTAFAQDRAPTYRMAITFPSDSVGAEPFNPKHYVVAVFDGFTRCPTGLENNYSDEGVLVRATTLRFDQINDETAIWLTEGHTYAVASYHRSGRGSDSMPLGSFTPESCRIFTVNGSNSVQPYAPLIGTFRASGVLLDMTVTIAVPQTQPGYELVQGNGPDCVEEFTENESAPTSHNKLDADATEIARRLTGGTWHLGVYRVKTDDVNRSYRLLRQTCQTFVVNDFDGMATYQPQLPKRVLVPVDKTAVAVTHVAATDKPKLEQQPVWFAAGGASAGFQGEGSTLGPLFRGGFNLTGLAVTGGFGAQFMPIPGEPASVRPTASLGLGYGRSFWLPRPWQWLPNSVVFQALLAGGVGSFQANCGPEEFDLDATKLQVTCGHGEGFPLRLVAPWIGPELSGQVLWPAKENTRLVGLDVTVAGEIYPAFNDWPRYAQPELSGRTATIHTSEGDRQVSFEFEHDTMAWVVPKLTVGVVVMW